MNYEMPSSIFNSNFRTDKMHLPYKPLEYALKLMIEAIQLELEAEGFFSYLIQLAPMEEEKNIILSIRDDEKKHILLFKEMYEYYSREKLPITTDIAFTKVTSYTEGLKKALFIELYAVSKYRDIRAGIPDTFFRDMVFEIITDELNHVNKYNYLLYLDLESKISKNNNNEQITSTNSRQKFYTKNDALLIAKILGINFNKEKFDLEQFRMGLDTELEHGKDNTLTNITDGDSIKTGKISLAHLRKIPDYYTRLEKMEYEAINSLPTK